MVNNPKKMKTISTLTVCLFLIINAGFAQYTQNFEESSLSSGCALVVNADRTTSTAEIITGTGSLYSVPPVNGSGTRDYATPYLNIIDITNTLATTTSLNISFDYKLNQTLNGSAVRTIEIGLLDKNGVFTSLDNITMNAANDPIIPVSFNKNYTSVSTGVKRLALRMGGAQGNGSVRIIIDNLYASANAYYNTTDGTCNSAPIAQNDVYTSLTPTTYTALVSVLNNDSDPNGETLSTPVIATQSPDGTVVMNANGTFTFTAATGFTGSSTTFTYSVSDNGYDVASATATVTINFVGAAPLPIKLLSFSGNILNSKAQLSWSVAENETGDHFEIEKSTDGKTFSNAGVLFTTNKIGKETYSFREASPLTATTYYRLKVINKDNSTSYSKIITLKTDKETAASSLTIVQNPVTSTLQFQHTATESGISKAILYNAAGVRVMSKDISVQKGSNAVSINLDHTINQGTYILEISSGRERSVAKLIKQ